MPFFSLIEVYYTSITISWHVSSYKILLITAISLEFQKLKEWDFLLFCNHKPINQVRSLHACQEQSKIMNSNQVGLPWQLSAGPLINLLN